MNYRTVCLAAMCLSAYIGAEEAPETKNSKKDIAQLSEAFGHLIGKNISSMGLQFDIAGLIKGLQDSSEGKNSPMTEAECIEALTSAQETAFKERSSKNLTSAEEFLKTNEHSQGIISLDEGKVQYKVEKNGNGEKLTENASPLIRYVGKFLDGTVFGSSSEDEPVRLDELIPGLRDGMIGMQEGEKRTVYIHPDLAYGTSGSLPPNSLLTFEIEVVKARAPEMQEALPPSSTEIAVPENIEQLQ